MRVARATCVRARSWRWCVCVRGWGGGGWGGAGAWRRCPGRALPDCPRAARAPAGPPDVEGQRCQAAEVRVPAGATCARARVRVVVVVVVTGGGDGKGAHVCNVRLASCVAVRGDGDGSATHARAATALGHQATLRGWPRVRPQRRRRAASLTRRHGCGVRFVDSVAKDHARACVRTCARARRRRRAGRGAQVHLAWW